MSINFDEPMNYEAREMLKKMVEEGELPEPIFQDDKHVLFDDALNLNRKNMGALARAAKQPVNVELNTEGEIKVMSDGAKYLVTRKGWKKIK